MRFINSLLYTILSLIFFLSIPACEPPDEGFPEVHAIENNAIISIEDNKNTFNVDDTIIIESLIENVQTTVNNQKINLTDSFYLDSPDTVNLYSTIHLYKESSFGNPVAISIADKYIEVINGDAKGNSNPGIEMTNKYNGTTFHSKFGIQLKEKGIYYLSGGRFFNDGKSTVLISGGVYQLGMVEINSKIINSDTNGLYKFTVN